MNHPYRTAASVEQEHAPPKKKRVLCSFGLHKLDSFRVNSGPDFKVYGRARVSVRFYCSCGKLLGALSRGGYRVSPPSEPPARAQITITTSISRTRRTTLSSVTYGWNGLGADNSHDESEEDNERGGIL